MLNLFLTSVQSISKHQNGHSGPTSSFCLNQKVLRHRKSVGLLDVVTTVDKYVSRPQKQFLNLKRRAVSLSGAKTGIGQYLFGIRVSSAKIRSLLGALGSSPLAHCSRQSFKDLHCLIGHDKYEIKWWQIWNQMMTNKKWNDNNYHIKWKQILYQMTKQ